MHLLPPCKLPGVEWPLIYYHLHNKDTFLHISLKTNILYTDFLLFLFPHLWEVSLESFSVDKNLHVYVDGIVFRLFLSRGVTAYNSVLNEIW